MTQFISMPNSTTSSSPFNFFSTPKKDETDPYRGAIEFKEHTIVFAYGMMTILRHNVTRVERYGVKRAYKVSDPLLVFSIFMAVIALIGASSLPAAVINL